MNFSEIFSNIFLKWISLCSLSVTDYRISLGFSLKIKSRDIHVKNFKYNIKYREYPLYLVFMFLDFFSLLVYLSFTIRTSIFLYYKSLTTSKYGLVSGVKPVYITDYLRLHTCKFRKTELLIKDRIKSLPIF